MSQSASQAAAFYKEVATNKSIWSLRDEGGIPTPKGEKEKRVMPFWSNKARVEKIIKTIPAYSGFEPFEITWDVFKEKWLPGLENDNLLVGINWSGEKAVGYDVEPNDALKNIEYYISNNT